MNKKKISVVLGFIGVIFLMLYILNASQMKMQFTKQKEDLRNPSRGFYVQIKSSKPERVEEIHEEGYRLVLVAYDIAEYRNDRIDEKKLMELENILSEIRAYHMKAIIRPAYGFEEMEYNDAGSFAQLEEHAEQIADVINANKDVILCVQAGFLGPWGEWHSSIYLSGEEEEKTEYRNRLLEKLLEEYDPSVIINVRRPRFLRDAQKAGLDMSRLGFHNDGLLASESDYGTYDDPDYIREEELRYINNAIATGINGGEMSRLSSFSSPQNSVEEFTELKISYLNVRYNKEVLESWKKETLEGENAYTYIEKRLGYRYFVKEIKTPWKISKLQLFRNFQQIELKMVNEGFAPIEDGYQIQWVVEYGNGVVDYLPLPESILSVESGGERDLVLELGNTHQEDITRIGIQIYDDSQQVIIPENCVEIANKDFSFEEGVNYILMVDEDGRIK